MAEMSLEQRQYLTAKFEEFVAAVHSDVKENQPVRKPYQWQIRLMLHVAEHGCWPQGIGAPTASGKTSVIDIHVFLNAMAGLISTEESADTQILADLPLQRIPRRLALTVNRRSLVDDQFDEACALQNKMQSENDKDDGLDVYRKGLNLRSAVNDGIKRELPNPQMIVVELRGGASPDREWRYYPQTCAVICATPDMFGSRLLFRGYGTSATMRSMEAGLLAYDTVLIADEAHLSRQLLRTARQVTRIENMNGNVGLLYASEAEERQLPKATVDPHSNMAIVNRWKKTSFLQNLKDNGKHPFQTRSEKHDAKLNCRRRELFTQNKNRKGGLPQE